MSAFAVFSAMFVLDFVWARYMVAAADHRAVAASAYSGAIIALGGIAQISYNQEPVLLIPAILGGVAGTFVALKRAR